jgi:hypothetical protein
MKFIFRFSSLFYLQKMYLCFQLYANRISLFYVLSVWDNSQSFYVNFRLHFHFSDPICRRKSEYFLKKTTFLVDATIVATCFKTMWLTHSKILVITIIHAFSFKISPSPEYPVRTVLNFFENSRRYSQVKVHQQYQRHRWQILPIVSLVLFIPVANNGNNIRLQIP